MTIAITKLFQPLTGLELRKMLVEDFDKMLANSGLFEAHLIMSPAEIDVNLTVEIPDMMAPKSFGFKRSFGEVPDEDRISHNMPITRPTPNENGQIVDAEVKLATSDSVGQVEGGPKVSETVGSGSKPRKKD